MGARSLYSILTGPSLAVYLAFLLIARKELYDDFSPMEKSKVKSIGAQRKSTDLINNIRKLIIAGSRMCAKI